MVCYRVPRTCVTPILEGKHVVFASKIGVKGVLGIGYMPCDEVALEALARGDLDDNVFHARELLKWQRSSHVEVYYAEFLLAQWVLDRAPWNAYHSGLAFVNNETGEKCCLAALGEK